MPHLLCGEETWSFIALWAVGVHGQAPLTGWSQLSLTLDTERSGDSKQDVPSLLSSSLTTWPKQGPACKQNNVLQLAHFWLLEPVLAVPCSHTWPSACSPPGWTFQGHSFHSFDLSQLVSGNLHSSAIHKELQTVCHPQGLDPEHAQATAPHRFSWLTANAVCIWMCSWHTCAPTQPDGCMQAWARHTLLWKLHL